jgi:hypothetical protein
MYKKPAISTFATGCTASQGKQELQERPLPNTAQRRSGPAGAHEDAAVVGWALGCLLQPSRRKRSLPMVTHARPRDEKEAAMLQQREEASHCGESTLLAAHLFLWQCRWILAASCQKEEMVPKE